MMKNALNKTLLFISVSAFAMESAPPLKKVSGKEEKKEVVKEKKQPKKSQRYKKLDLNIAREETLIPQGKVGKTHAFIDLLEKEDLTLETFKDLIKKQQEKNLPFLLAVVTTRPDNKRTYRFYSGTELNNHLFKSNFSKNRLDQPLIQFLDPKNHKIIVGEILYFTINSLDDEFNYLCSDYDLFIGSPDKRHFLGSYLKAIENNQVAQTNLGIFFLKGLGVKQNYNQALRWFKSAAQQGDAEAQFGLANMYFQGLGISKDYQEAAQWFKAAAEQGSAQAQNTLGVLYRDGLGVEQDFIEAEKWFKAAAEQGFELAQQNLKKLQESSKK